MGRKWRERGKGVREREGEGERERGGKERGSKR